MRNKLIVAVSLIVLLALMGVWAGSAFAQTATPEAEDEAERPAVNRTLTVNGSGKLYLTPDIAYITQPEHLPYFVASTMESLHQGPRAWAMESVLINQPWSIDLAEVRVPVHLWHGTHDGLVPMDMVEGFRQALPEAELTVLEGDTHLLAFRNIDRLVKAIHHAEMRSARPQLALRCTGR